MWTCPVSGTAFKRTGPCRRIPASPAPMMSCSSSIAPLTAKFPCRPTISAWRPRATWPIPVPAPTLPPSASPLEPMERYGTPMDNSAFRWLQVKVNKREEPSHLRRDLRLVSCAEGGRHLSQWTFPGANPTSEGAPSAMLMNDALDSALVGDPWEIEKMGASGDPTYILVLVEMMRFPWWRINPEIDEAILAALNRIAEQNPDIAEVNPDLPLDEWFRWVVWIGKHPEVRPPPGFAGWKGRLYTELVDPAMGAFLYDGIRSNIRVEEIVLGRCGQGRHTRLDRRSCHKGRRRRLPGPGGSGFRGFLQRRTPGLSAPHCKCPRDGQRRGWRGALCVSLLNPLRCGNRVFHKHRR